MKKALISLSVATSSIMLAAAQIGGTITIGFGQGQGQVQGGQILQLLALAQTIVTRLVPFMVGLAVLAFFWFLVNFIWLGKDKPEDQQKNLRGMGYSILALFVMVSIWGLVGFLGSVFGIQQGGSVPIPGIPIPAQ